MHTDSVDVWLPFSCLLKTVHGEGKRYWEMKGKECR